MKLLLKYIRTNEEVQQGLASCNCENHRLIREQEIKHWTSYLNGRIKLLVEATCCARVRQPLLKYGAGSNVKTPSLIP